MRTSKMVVDEAKATDWHKISLADACKLADFELYKAVGQLVCMRIDCKDCPMNDTIYLHREDCEDALGKCLLGGEGVG